jgi:hypothetical protein
MLERVGPDISFGNAGAGKESIYWTSGKQKNWSFTMLAPTASTFICAKFFELQAHIKSSLFFEDFLESQITLICRSSTWW